MFGLRAMIAQFGRSGSSRDKPLAQIACEGGRRSVFRGPIRGATS
jgi:hypothetical protein